MIRSITLIVVFCLESATFAAMAILCQVRMNRQVLRWRISDFRLWRNIWLTAAMAATGMLAAILIAVLIPTT